MGYQKHPMPPHMHPPPPHSIYVRPHQHLHHPGISGYPPYHYAYPSPHPLPPHHHPYPMYAISHPLPNLGKPSMKISQKVQYQKGSSLKGGLKRPMPQQSSTIKKQKKNSTMKVKHSGQSGKKSPKSCGATIATPELNNSLERQKAAAAITAMNAAAGHKNDKAAALAAAILRGVTMRPSGKCKPNFTMLESHDILVYSIQGKKLLLHMKLHGKNLKQINHHRITAPRLRKKLKLT